MLHCFVAAAADPQFPARIIRNIAYTNTPAGRLLLNIHLPARKTALVPVVLYIHGGDWMFGNREHPSGAFLTHYGIAVASMDYRLAPRNRFPAQAKDCRDALIFLHKNARKYGIDPDQIGIMGESAGGHLAALTATAPDAPEFIGSFRDKETPRVKAFCSISGPMDIVLLGTMGDFVEGIVGKHPIQQLLGGRVGDHLALAKLASPIEHVSADDPPSLLIYGEIDFLVPPVVAHNMHAALLAQGIKSELYPVAGMGHDMRDIYNDRTREVIAGFFQRNLLGYPATRPASQ